ncbi:hypothetical protein MTP99_012963 [Tenebrio molitor]|nr:hypothetical protein MTP99_012963 [Tenebrio molitor]
MRGLMPRRRSWAWMEWPGEFGLVSGWEQTHRILFWWLFFWGCGCSDILGHRAVGRAWAVLCSCGRHGAGIRRWGWCRVWSLVPEQHGYG